MDLSRYGPWLIPAGYALALMLLIAGSKTEGALARAGYASAGLVGSATTFYWLTLGQFSGPFMYIWALAPVAFVALVAARKYRQSEWMDRLAGRTGRVFTEERAGRPTFGVLPGSRGAVDHEDDQAGFDSAVELDINGHGVVGVQYRSGQEASTRPFSKTARFGQAIDMADSTHGLVQLRCAEVPALLIVPRSYAERVERFGALEAGRTSPFEDFRISRNIIGALQPDAKLAPVEADGFDPEFARYFSVRAADPAVARAFLTPEVQQLIVADAWFRTREVACHNGALWTSEFGQLTEPGFVANSRHLAQLAAAVPAEAWRAHAPAGTEAERFIAVARSADTSPAAWYQGCRTITAAINERRLAANRVPLAPAQLVLRASVIVVLAWFAVVLAFPQGAADSEALSRGIAGVLFCGGAALALAKITFFPRPRTKAPQANAVKSPASPG
jgi:hypothetical protein